MEKDFFDKKLKYHKGLKHIMTIGFPRRIIINRYKQYSRKNPKYIFARIPCNKAGYMAKGYVHDYPAHYDNIEYLYEETDGGTVIKSIDGNFYITYLPIEVVNRMLEDSNEATKMEIMKN